MECLVFMPLVRHMLNFGIIVLESLPMLLHYDMFGRPLSRSPFELLQLHHPIPWNLLIIYQYLMLLKRLLIYLVKKMLVLDGIVMGPTVSSNFIIIYIHLFLKNSIVLLIIVKVHWLMHVEVPSV